MQDHSASRTVVHFGVFEADLQAGELRKAGSRIKLQAQPFRVLALLLQRSGEVVTRDEIARELWGGETFVDFDQSIGAVMRKLRRALGDTAASPRYIETLREKGYRFLVPPVDAGPAPPASSQSSRRALPAPIIATAATSLLVTLMLSGWYLPKSRDAAGSVETQRRAPERSQNLDAYIAYQKGRYLWKTRTQSAVETSIEYFQQAVNLDPEYAAAYAALAEAYIVLNFYSGRNAKAPVERAKAASARALQLNPSAAGAHAALAYIKFNYEWDWPGAEEAFRTAIALDPNYATSHQWFAEYLFYMGRFEESRKEIDRAHQLDPQSVVINFQLAGPEYYSKDYAGAIGKIQEARRLDPDFALGIFMMATCYEELGRFDEAIAEYTRISQSATGLAALGYVYGKSGRRQEAFSIIARLAGRLSRDKASPYHVARVYAGLGNASHAIAWLERARKERDERMVMIKVDQKLDGLRSDPRFQDLLRSLRLG